MMRPANRRAGGFTGKIVSMASNWKSLDAFDQNFGTRMAGRLPANP